MKVLNLPNQLTISRILIVPVLVAVLAVGSQWACLLAGILFALGL